MRPKWTIIPAISPESVFGGQLIKKYPDYHPVIWQLLHNRGLNAEDEVKSFLRHEVNEARVDPFLFKQMDQAADLVIRHIKAGHKIIVFGDYDADGVTSSAILFETLRLFRADADVYIPHRVAEGYGLNKPAIKKIAESGTKLIITVDNGIRNKAEVEYAQALGLDVLITDHHLGPDNRADLPPCLIINPAIKDEAYPAGNLAGVGVAFKLVQALVRRSRLDEITKKKLESRILDLVSVGTVADCVGLSGENRLLVKQGLEILNSTNRAGLKELIKSAGRANGSGLDAWNIGFQIAPRLNAAGRLDHALSAFELLTTKDESRAAELAKILNEHNQSRQNLTEKIVEAIIARFGPAAPEKKIIIAVSPLDSGSDQAWNEGVVGLVAGRIAERYYLPVLVITESEGVLKGSSRSIPEFNIARAVEECRDLLLKAGGHPAACGFSLEKSKLAEFAARIEEIAWRELGGLELSPEMKIEAEIELADVSETLADQIAMFSPFGQDNEQPKLLARAAAVADRNLMGADGQHVKFRLKKSGSGLVNAVGFYQAEKWADINLGDAIDLVFYLDVNEWNGRREAQLKIVDIRKS